MNVANEELQAALNVVLEENMYLGQVLFYCLDRLFLQVRLDPPRPCLARLRSVPDCATSLCAGLGIKSNLLWFSDQSLVLRARWYGELDWHHPEYLDLAANLVQSSALLLLLYDRFC